MRNWAVIILLAASLSACMSNPPAPAPEKTEQPAGKFVSNPELKDVMGAMVEDFSETIWNIGLDENTPKSDDDWKKFEHAAVGLIETGKFIQTSHLAKDQGKWKEESQKMIDIAELCRKAIKEKNKDAVVEAGNKLNDESCVSCHKIYYNEGQ